MPVCTRTALYPSSTYRATSVSTSSVVSALACPYTVTPSRARPPSSW